MGQLDEKGVIIPCPQCGQRNRIGYGRLDGMIRCGNCKSELKLPGVPFELPSERVFDALVGQSVLPLLVDFWADWCGPCKMMAPQLEQFAGENAGRWLVVKVDTEALPGLAQRHRISALPTLAIYIAGREINRAAGARTAVQIQELVDQAIVVE